MYLPNNRYIPAPFNQGLSDNKAPERQTELERKTEPDALPEPDIVAAEAPAKNHTQNDNMENMLLVLLLLDAIH